MITQVPEVPEIGMAAMPLPETVSPVLSPVVRFSMATSTDVPAFARYTNTEPVTSSYSASTRTAEGTRGAPVGSPGRLIRIRIGSSDVAMFVLEMEFACNFGIHTPVIIPMTRRRNAVICFIPFYFCVENCSTNIQRHDWFISKNNLTFLTILCL